MKYCETDLVILCFFPSTFLPPILMSKILGSCQPLVRFSNTMNLFSSFLNLQRPARWFNHSLVFFQWAYSAMVMLGQACNAYSPQYFGMCCWKAAKGCEMWYERISWQKSAQELLQPFSSLVWSEVSNFGYFPLTWPTQTQRFTLSLSFMDMQEYNKTINLFQVSYSKGSRQEDQVKISECMKRLVWIDSVEEQFVWGFEVSLLSQQSQYSKREKMILAHLWLLSSQQNKHLSKSSFPPSERRLIRVLQVQYIILLLIAPPKHSNLLLKAIHQLLIAEQKDAMLLSQAYLLLQQPISNGADQVSHLVVYWDQQGDAYLAWDLAVLMIGLEADEHCVAGFCLLHHVLSELDALLNSRKELFEWSMAQLYLGCLCCETVHCK